MPSDEITQIKVGKHRMGIIGLKKAMADMAPEFAEKSDDKIQAELMRRLSKNNYISEHVKADYARAFLREFKKYVGKPVPSEENEGIDIKVLGSGCARCNQLEQDLMAVMAEMNLPADIEHITDIAEIGSYGVMGNPALIINGAVKSVGSIPSRAQLKTWLTEAGRQK
jgi:hypothetical protein